MAGAVPRSAVGRTLIRAAAGVPRWRAEDRLPRCRPSRPFCKSERSARHQLVVLLGPTAGGPVWGKGSRRDLADLSAAQFALVGVDQRDRPPWSSKSDI